MQEKQLESTAQPLPQVFFQENLLITDDMVVDTQTCLGSGASATFNKVKLQGRYGGLTAAEKIMQFEHNPSEIILQSQSEVEALLYVKYSGHFLTLDLCICLPVCSEN